MQDGRPVLVYTQVIDSRLATGVMPINAAQDESPRDDIRHDHSCLASWRLAQYFQWHNLATQSSSLRKSLAGVLFLAVPTDEWPAFGEVRIRRENIASLARPLIAAGEITQPEDITIAIFGLWAVDWRFSKNH